MTEGNYNYRTSQTLLRNQFPGKGKLKIPIIPKFQERPGDFDDLLLIGFDKTHLEDQNHLDRMVHFFLYDYRFERVWKKPDNDIEKLSRYRAVLSPDFSMYLEMAPVMQLYEDLAVKIQGGERELLPQLWEQVERFVRQQAYRRTCMGAVDHEDLYQSGFLAVVKAVGSYDPGHGMKL